MIKRIGTILLVGVLGAGIAVGAASAAEETQAQKPAPKPAKVENVGDPVVDVSLPAHDGKSARLAQLVGKKGKSVVIWAQSACGSCRNELGRLRELKKKFPDVNFVVVMVDVGGREIAGKLIKKYGITDIATVLYDTEFKTSELFNVFVTPAVLIFKDGKLAVRLVNLNPRKDFVGNALATL
ncbi:TlpA family protein disulfide reductase [Deferrisoma camini]|uniref:TlpA family protein disulfide reductase n=1 Tax=Deferrisoma camini TaxID=1035120 RepID=UPI00046CCE12|nr:TlpA disulfide reductase family protein [Deferrisoma camini]